jgi:hypothetical protein
MKTYKRVKEELATHRKLSKREVALSASKGPDGKWEFEAVLWFSRFDEAQQFQEWLEKRGWFYYIGPNNWRRFKIDISPRGLTPPSIRETV